MDIAKTAAWIRRALSGLFAVLMTIGSFLSGEPYIASGDAELKRSLLYSYAEGVSFICRDRLRRRRLLRLRRQQILEL